VKENKLGNIAGNKAKIKAITKIVAMLYKIVKITFLLMLKRGILLYVMLMKKIKGRKM